jgi:type II secretory pathway pseudopilin PulG
MKKKLSYLKSDLGYTLIELLTVIVVMVVVGLIIVTVLVSSLRGGNKAQVINEIRDSGNTAMTQMAKFIEFGKSFIGAVDEQGNILIPCPSSPTSYKQLKIKGFNDQIATLSCNGTTISSTGGLLNPQAVDLIGDSSIKVKNDTCYFTCSQAYDGQPPTIGINFTLEKNANSSFFEQNHELDFHTSVVMHNLPQ